ncbi:MAG: beta-ketoacyl-ACP synthase 3 [Candidatus Ozemobacteraceae bacterium]
MGKNRHMGRNLINTIIGTGSYLPENRISNDDLAKVVDLSDYDEMRGGPYPQWVERVMGFKFRYRAAPNQATSDLALEAAEKALASAGISALDLDLIIVTTATPDKKGPNTASILQAKLHASEKACFAFDLNAACPGFVYALHVADSLMKNGKYRLALVVAADKMSTIVDQENYITAATFSDAAGAVVLNYSSAESGILEAFARSDGGKGGLLDVPAGGSSLPITLENCAEIYRKKLHCITMNSHGTKNFAVEKLCESVSAVLGTPPKSLMDISYFLFHQAGKGIIEECKKNLNLETEKVLINYDRYANSSLASIPILLDENHHLFKPGNLILLAAMGGGLGWGSVLYRW